LVQAEKRAAEETAKATSSARKQATKLIERERVRATTDADRAAEALKGMRRG
jgi:vacuolar-type H+-ATPase subunit H